MTSMKLRKLEGFYLTTLNFLQPLSLAERYKVAIEEARRITGTDYGSVFLEENGSLVRVYSTVPVKTRTNPRKRGYTYQALTNGKVFVMNKRIIKKVHPNIHKNGSSSITLIPLMFNKKSIGVIALQSHEEKHYSEDIMHILNLFGSMVSLGIRNSQLFEEVKAAVQARDLFLSLASHELKTPLTTISMYAEFIGRKVNSNEMPSLKHVLVLQSEVRRLTHMFNELLALDQIKKGKLNYFWKKVHVMDILDIALINFKSSYPKYKVFIENSIKRKDGEVLGDSEKLQQVFTNILNNAAKFSSYLTPIIIQIKSDDSYVVISIIDYGRGIRKKEQAKVFEEFFRGTENDVGGMGLGLYLVRSIVEAHKGIISVDSKLHKGTTISVKLPQKLYEG